MDSAACAGTHFSWPQSLTTCGVLYPWNRARSEVLLVVTALFEFSTLDVVGGMLTGQLGTAWDCLIDKIRLSQGLELKLFS